MEGKAKYCKWTHKLFSTGGTALTHVLHREQGAKVVLGQLVTWNKIEIGNIITICHVFYILLPLQAALGTLL